MRIYWGVGAVVSIAVALVVGFQLTQPEAGNLLRGVALLPKSQPQPSDEALLASPELVNELQAPAAGEDLDINTSNLAAPSLSSLNLSLPELNLDGEKWQATPRPSPDFFGKTTELSRMDVSGRLHFDESEAARVKPLEDTLLGAEVELKIRL